VNRDIDYNYVAWNRELMCVAKCMSWLEGPQEDARHVDGVVVKLDGRGKADICYILVRDRCLNGRRFQNLAVNQGQDVCVWLLGRVGK